MPYTNLVARRAYQATFYRREYKKNRDRCFELLTPKCVKCGFDDIRALNIDHVNGGGTKEAKSFGGSYYKKIRLKLESGSREYQILCANCNQIKRHETNAVLV
jgi:hypothetical protein